MAAGLKPGGFLVVRDIVYSFELAEPQGAIDSWIEAGVASSAEGWTPQELAEHVREEHSTFISLLEAMFEHGGFDIDEVIQTDSKIYAYVCRIR